MASITGFGTEGVPSFQLISTTNISTNKTIQIQSDDALVFNFNAADGTFIGQIASPDGAGPYVASGSLIPVPYPTTVTVTVLDKSTQVQLGMTTLQLFGGDVFKCRVSYKEYVPIANGYVAVLLNGQQTIVRGQIYGDLPYDNDDVIPRGGAG